MLSSWLLVPHPGALDRSKGVRSTGVGVWRAAPYRERWGNLWMGAVQ